jgi:NarL family two-component system sensor histidine kinase LiaS
MSQPRRRSPGLFWRMAVSYLAVSVVATLLTYFASRYEGPFGFLRDSAWVRFFSHIADNQTNSALLLVAVVSGIGVFTGAVISTNLRRRLKRMGDAAEAWSRGDFAASVHDGAGDELGQLARDLDHMAEQLQSLLESRQELAVVEERNRLARELHDSVKQQVFAGALLVRAARKQMQRDPDLAASHLAEAETLAERTQAALTELIRALRPASLADKGLVPVLCKHVDEWSRQSGIAAEVLAQGERTTPLEAEEALYRVAQEALANVAKHSGAQHAQVRLAWEHRAVRMTVYDDGAGFDAASLTEQGFGLRSMRERLTALDGTLTVESAPGTTTLTAWVPLPVRAPGVTEVAHA